jgi:hypothetical protein
VATNPILDELSSLSPEAKSALLQAHQQAQAIPQGAMNPITSGLKAANVPAPPMLQPPSSMNSTPAMGMPSVPTTPSPSIVAPRGTVAGDTSERSRLMSSGSGIQQIPSKIEASQFGQNHPTAAKILGGVAQTGATLGDIALNTIGGGYGRLAATEIPGTNEHHNMLLKQANTAVGQDEANAEKEAQTGALQAEVPLRQAQAAALPGETADKRALTQSEIDKNTAEIKGLENPWAKAPDNQPLQAVDQLNKAMADRYQVLHPGVQPPAEFQLPANATKGDFDRIDKLMSAEETASGNQANRQQSNQMREAMLAIAQQNAGDKNLWSVPNGDGTSRVVSLRPGDTIPQGAVSLAGQNTVNTPTSQQRTAAGRAETVLTMAPEVIQRIDATAKEMGPLAGRWNEFMQGKIGAPDQPMAELRSDLLMMSSAVALAHAQGRLPENLREEFDREINAPDQTPENLKGAIRVILPWMQQVQAQGEGAARQNAIPAPKASPGQAPAIGAVEGGYRFKGGNPADQKNWEKAQ